MALNLIVGRSNTGKSEYIMNKIMACEEEKTQAILFVPSTSRVMAEEEYFYYTNKKASRFFHHGKPFHIRYMYEQTAVQQNR